MVVLSHLQARQILEVQKNVRSALSVSLDLNLTESEVRLQPDCVLFPAGESLDWKSLEEISGNETACYTVEGHTAKAIKGFSEFSGRVYGLMPTNSAPTMLISGIPMHRIKDTNPHQDTLNKIKAIAPVKGDVLDTTTGLGYTAIEAAKTARHVTTIEIDPTAQEIARLIPGRGICSRTRKLLKSSETRSTRSRSSRLSLSQRSSMTRPCSAWRATCIPWHFTGRLSACSGTMERCFITLAIPKVSPAQELQLV